MSDLYAFLHSDEVSEEKEVIISDRFKDENGKIVPFKIRSLSQEEVENLAQKSRKIRRINGKRMESVDDLELSRRIVVAGTVFPDFSNTELCNKYGTLDPLVVAVRMLKSGEFKALASQISNLSGYDDLVEEVKN